MTVPAPPAGVQIRPATADDVAAITAVAAVTFPDACPPTTTRAAMDAHIAAKLNERVIAGWIAQPGIGVHVAVTAAEDVVGYVMVEAAPEPEPAVVDVLGETPVGCLSKIYVLGSARGTGAAAALVAAGEAELSARGLRHVWLGTNVDNARANAFYERRGYRAVGYRQFDVGGTLETDVTRLKAL
ncbi:MAG: GNAT family N-acetyltransferase [Micrococcus sp.]|nr:GNAT family N-acetyltransferase [Micrococcus sp.]